LLIHSSIGGWPTCSAWTHKREYCKAPIGHRGWKGNRVKTDYALLGTRTRVQQ